MPDTIPGDITTSFFVTVGGSITGVIETYDDSDWFGLALMQGQTVQVDLKGITLSDPYLEIFDASGEYLFFNDNTDFSTNNSSLIFTADYTGTYYIGATSYYYFDSVTSDIGLYRISVSAAVAPYIAPFEPSPTLAAPLDSVSWGTQLSDTVVTVFFAPNGYTADGITSEGFNAYEIGQFNRAFDLISAVSDLTFVVQATDEEADFRLVLDTNEPIGLLGYMNPPGFTTNAGVGVFAGNDWDRVAGGDLDEGGFSFVTIVHELLHGLGLSHPHDDADGGSVIMDGVFNDSDTGTYDMNQGVYTMMTYVDGFATGAPSQSSQATYGNQAAPMALDIAVLQALYGANMDHNTGNNTYYLPGSNVAGTSWLSIWDAGGNDTIAYAGTKGVTINMGAATLENDFDGGGYLSYVYGIAGGYTIANGVEIENASGGSGADDIVDNALDNVIYGNGGDDYVYLNNGGNDSVYGGAGSDLIYVAGDLNSLRGDYVNGGNGSDALVMFDVTGFNNTAPMLNGGLMSSIDLRNIGGGQIAMVSEAGVTLAILEGIEDIATFAATMDIATLLAHQDAAAIIQSLGGLSDFFVAGEGDDVINAGTGFDLVRGLGGNDSIMGLNGFDTLYGDMGQDTLAGNSGNDVLYGGEGEDRLIGGIGFDSLYGGQDDDVLIGQDGRDLLNGGNGDDDLFGNAGNDELVGGAGNDDLYGGQGFDTLTGGNGNDFISGGNGSDLLYGGNGDDKLFGNSGNDVLAGGSGNDDMRGGIGADTFIFAAGNDLIRDFSSNVDQLQIYFGAFGIESFAEFKAQGQIVDGRAVFTFDASNSLTMNNITNLNAIEDNFSFLYDVA